MIERRYESQISSCRWKVNVGARLVGFRFERKAIVVTLIDRILAEIIDCVAKSFDRLVWTTAGIGLNAFSSAPHHENLRSQLRADLHRLHSLLKRVGSDARIVRGESAVAKYRIVEEIHRSHRDLEAGFLASTFELAH